VVELRVDVLPYLCELLNAIAFVDVPLLEVLPVYK
jgi:hypothetical protein